MKKIHHIIILGAIILIVVYFTIELNGKKIYESVEKHAKIIANNLDLGQDSDSEELNEIKISNTVEIRETNTSNNLDLNKDSNLEEIFQDFFNQTSDQRLFSKATIFRTMRYMMEERNEYDPELVAFVRSLIAPPPPKSKKLNLHVKGKTDFSQIGQSKYIDKLLESKKNGFFIESGGYDGETFSNTLFFELERNWTGILIEPIPSLFNRILSRNRQIYALNACIAGKKPLVAKFRESNVLSSRTSEMSKQHESRINKEYGNKEIYLYVPCFSLNTILKAIGVDKVDYFSLDVEGGEFSVLKDLNFNSLGIKAFSIEYNGVKEEKQKIQSYMEANQYKLTKDDKQDIYFLKK